MKVGRKKSYCYKFKDFQHFLYSKKILRVDLSDGQTIKNDNIIISLKIFNLFWIAKGPIYLMVGRKILYCYYKFEDFQHF